MIEENVMETFETALIEEGLTEEEFFLGKLDHIRQIKQKIKLPVLCKDFFVDKFQVPLAKSYGADAILIILAGVSESLANDLYEEALRLNMSVIVEVHTVEEAKQALKFKNALIGINNRNLKTLKTDLKTTYDIHDVLINHTYNRSGIYEITGWMFLTEIVEKLDENNLIIITPSYGKDNLLEV